MKKVLQPSGSSCFTKETGSFPDTVASQLVGGTLSHWQVPEAQRMYEPTVFPLLYFSSPWLLHFYNFLKVTSARKMNPFEIQFSHILLTRTNVFCARTLGLKKWAWQTHHLCWSLNCSLWGYFPFYMKGNVGIIVWKPEPSFQNLLVSFDRIWIFISENRK